jgi:hypothetical protein
MTGIRGVVVGNWFRVSGLSEVSLSRVNLTVQSFPLAIQHYEPSLESVEHSLLYGIRAWHEEESMGNYPLLRKCLGGDPKHLNRRNNAHAYETV